MKFIKLTMLNHSYSNCKETEFVYIKKCLISYIDALKEVLNEKTNINSGVALRSNGGYFEVKEKAEDIIWELEKE